jgi:tRNA (adenine57-N1/adenine58-N1)-methyltransferase catalytic subunit
MRQVQSKNGKGFIHVLWPTPELWTDALRHRTQILYMPDNALIASLLALRPGAAVVEAGTGSGSLSTTLARTVAPHGRLHTFDFHQGRAAEAKFSRHFSFKTCRKEFELNGLGGVVVSKHRDVVADGFDDVANADALFLDVPSPWLAVDHVRAALKSGGRFVYFSPCVEQVQRTAAALRQKGFTRPPPPLGFAS